MSIHARLRAAARAAQTPAAARRPGPGRPVSGRFASVRREDAEPTLAETARVLALPAFDYEASVAGFNMDALFKAPRGAMSLRIIQAAALLAIRHAQGGVLPIGVGHGKTLIGLLAGTAMNLPASMFPPVIELERNAAGIWVDSGRRSAVPSCAPIDRVLYLTAAGAVNQTRRAVLEMAKHWDVHPRIIVRSYSELSQPKATSALAEWIGRPGNRSLVVLDEAHKLKRPEAARTKRFLRAWRQLPDVRYVVTSGTLISRSLKDGATLAAVALRAHSLDRRPRHPEHGELGHPGAPGRALRPAPRSAHRPLCKGARAPCVRHAPA